MTHTNDSDYMSLHQPLDSYKNIYKDLHNKHVNDMLDKFGLRFKKLISKQTNLLLKI